MEVYVSVDSEWDHSPQKDQNLLGGTPPDCGFLSIEVLNFGTWVEILEVK